VTQVFSSETTGSRWLGRQLYGELRGDGRRVLRSQREERQRRCEERARPRGRQRVEGLTGLYLLRRLATSSTVVFAFGFGLGLGASFTGPWLLAAVGGVSVWRFRQTLTGWFGVG
jgi:hypothetical protein